MLTQFSNGYLEKGRLLMVYELATKPGLEAMLCIDGGKAISIQFNAEDLPAIALEFVELTTTDDCKVWVDPARVIAVVNCGCWQITLANGYDFDVVDIAPLLKAIGK